MEEIRAMLWMLLCGVLCGMQYDIICILRVLMHLSSYSDVSVRLDAVVLPGIGAASIRKKSRSHPAKSFWIAAGDICFALAAACTFSIFLSHALYGMFRWYCLLAALAGYGVYRKTIGRGVLYFSEILAGILRILLRYVGWILFLPLRILLRIGTVLAHMAKVRILSPMRRNIRRSRQRKYTRKVQMELRTAMKLS